MKGDEVWLFSMISPSRSWLRISRGTLHPHPLNSENLVKRKVGSKRCSSGSNGLWRLRLVEPVTSNSTAWRAAMCWLPSIGVKWSS